MSTQTPIAMNDRIVIVDPQHPEFDHNGIVSHVSMSRVFAILDDGTRVTLLRKQVIRHVSIVKEQI